MTTSFRLLVVAAHPVPGERPRAATRLEVTASRPGDAGALWSVLRTTRGLGDERTTLEVRGTTAAVERVDERQGLVRLMAPVPGMLSVFTYGEGDDQAAGVRANLFSADAAEYVRREEPVQQAWLEGLSVRA